VRRPARAGATVSRRDDSGRLSVFVAITVTGLLFIIGVAHDVSAQARATLHADLVAAEAARAAGQAVDPDRVAAAGEHRVDPVAATEAAQAYLADAGVTGSVEFSDDLTEITVTVSGVHPRLILRMFGFSEHRVQRSATAHLVAG
jgi:hypothetical protein